MRLYSSLTTDNENIYENESATIGTALINGKPVSITKFQVLDKLNKAKQNKLPDNFDYEGFRSLVNDILQLINMVLLKMPK